MPIAVTLAAAVAGAALASALRIPAGALIGAMLAVGILKITGVPTFDLPRSGQFVIYCGVGWLLGQTFTPDSLRQLKTAALPIIVVVALFIVFGFALAWGMWRFASFDLYTAFLATAPGGIAQMGALSVASQTAVVPVVLTVHLLRITSVIIITSIGLRWLEGRA
jgi:membrane AbrB-like protein